MKGFEYYKVIKDNNYNINLKLIKRTTNYYQDKEESNIFASASYIRNLIENNENYNHYIPYDYKIIDIREAENKISTIINYQTASWNFKFELENINNNEEGIINYIINNGDFTSNYDVLLESLKNKKYTINRIRRVLLSILLKLPKGYNQENKYLRLLGITNKGRKHLSNLPKETKNIIFSTQKELSKLNNTKLNTILNFELASTKLYGLLTNNNDLYMNEFKLPMKEEK